MAILNFIWSVIFNFLKAFAGSLADVDLAYAKTYVGDFLYFTQFLTNLCLIYFVFHWWVNVFTHRKQWNSFKAISMQLKLVYLVIKHMFTQGRKEERKFAKLYREYIQYKERYVAKHGIIYRDIKAIYAFFDSDRDLDLKYENLAKRGSKGGASDEISY